MITDLYTAAQEIMQPFRDLATAQGWPVQWPNEDLAKPDSRSATWAIFKLEMVTGGQGALNEDVARWSKGGFVQIEIYTELGMGLQASMTAAHLAVKAYERPGKTPSQIWFRDVHSRDDDGPGRAGWHRTNVFADFIFDTL